MGIEELDPLRDLDSVDFSGLLQGETLEDIATNEALRFWPGALKSVVRGGTAGLLLGGALSHLANYPAGQGATYGMLLFGAADFLFYRCRYDARCAREMFGEHPVRIAAACIRDYMARARQ